MANLPLSRPVSGCVASPRGGATLVRTPARLARFFAIWRQRKHLSELDAHMLKDIGVTPDQAREESLRPIWDSPETWRR